MQAYQYLDVDIVAPVFNFIKNKGQAQVFSFEFCHFFLNKTLTQVFSFESCEFFQRVTYKKQDSS